jgi:hypothetical protein
MAVIDVQRPSKAPQGSYSPKAWAPYTRVVEPGEERRVDHSPKKVSERRANIKPVTLPPR